MKFTLQFPAAFDARPPRISGERKVVAFFEDEFEIDEIDASEAPLAFAIEDADHIQGEDAGRQVRLRDGRFLVDTALVPERLFGDDRYDGLSSHPVHGVCERLKRLYRFGDTEPMWPANAMGVVGERYDGTVYSEKSKLAVPLMTKAAELADSASRRAQVAEYADMVRLTMSRSAVIDGTVWVDTPVPCYVLGMGIGVRRFEELTTVFASVYDKLRSGYVNGNDWRYLRNEGRYFGALERDAAYAAAEEDAALRGVPFDRRNLPNISVLMEGLPVPDFRALEFERVARLLVHDVADNWRGQAHGFGVDIFYDLPRETLDVFADARDALAGMDGSRGITETEEAAVLALVRVVDASAGSRRPFAGTMNQDVIHRTVDAWLERSVDLHDVSPSLRA